VSSDLKLNTEALLAFFSGVAARPGSEMWEARMAAEKIRRIAASRRHALTRAPTGALEHILSDEIALLDEHATMFESIAAEARREAAVGGSLAVGLPNTLADRVASLPTTRPVEEATKWSSKVRVGDPAGLRTEMAKVTREHAEADPGSLGSGNPATDEQIAELEKIEGITLPADYRAFLQTHNGGRPIPDQFPIGADNGSLLDAFFRLGEGEGRISDLQTNCDQFRGKIPHSMMPIGRDARGNIILLGVHGEPYGRVFFLDYMNPRPIFEIAPSFEAFLDSFEPRSEN
jgi:cell wall assembly regulator SMI1